MSSNLITQPYKIILDPTGGGGRAKPVSNGLYYVGERGLDPIANPRTDLFYQDESGTERPLTSPLILNSSGAFVVSKSDGTLIQPYMKGAIGHSALIVDKNEKPIYSNKTVGDEGNVQKVADERIMALSPDITDIAYKASDDKSAIENMLAGNPISSRVGDICDADGSFWKMVTKSDPVVITDFSPLSETLLTSFSKGSSISIDSAVDMAIGSGGKEIKLPPEEVKTEGFKLKSEKEIVGEGRLKTTISSNAGSVVLTYDSDQSQDAMLKGVTVKGGGKTSVGTIGVDLKSPQNIQKNALRNTFDKVAIKDCEIGISSNSGWSNIFSSYRVTDCGTGYKSQESWVSGWGGSGNVSIGGYYASCTTGIDTTTQWNMPFINTIIEYCDTPIYERGNGNTFINTWCENNSNPIKVIRGSVFINGRGLSFDVSEITEFQKEEALTLISNKGVKVVRSDMDKPMLDANGEGVSLRTPTGGGEFRHRRTAYSGSGERVSFESTTYTGTTTDVAVAETIPISSVKQLVSADGSNNLFGAVAFFAGKSSKQGVRDSSDPYEEKWRVRYDGGFRPSKSSAFDIGSSSYKVKNIYLANAPSVTSDERLKTEITPVSDLVLDAWKQVKWGEFKLLDRIEHKGEDKARIHVGIGAQTVINCFEEKGLDALEYAIVRVVYDDDDEVEEIPESERKWHYEVVYTEALALEAALMRRTIERLESSNKTQ